MNYKRIEYKDGNYYLSGTSEVFDTQLKAIKRAKQLNRVDKKTKGRRFISSKLNMAFRSNWEIELAELLHDLDIEFKYEPKRFYFNGEHESYLPDFYLPEYNCFIEVKGYMDKRSERRCRLFKKYHGTEYGFFLYEEEERKLVLNDPAILFTLLEVANLELERLKEKQMK